MGAKTSKLYFADYGGHRPASVGFSIKKNGVEDSLPRPKGSAGDRLLASLAEPKLGDLEKQ